MRERQESLDTAGAQRSEGRPYPIISVGDGPLSSVYPFLARDVAAVLGAPVSALRRLLRARRRSAAPAVRGRGAALACSASVGATWHFRLLHAAGVLLLLPVVAAARLPTGRRREQCKESVFGEANRAVLTALGFALMT